MYITNCVIRGSFTPETFFFNSVLRPFQDYFSSYEMGQSVGGRKRENPEENHLAHLLVSHVARAGLEPTPDTAVK